MFQKRTFLNAAALFLGAAVVSAVPAFAQGTAPAAGSSHESLLVLRVDVAGLVNSPLYKQLVAQYGEQMASKDPNYLQFKQATGFNPETDLSALTIGAAGDLGSKEPKIYAIIEGKFDQAKIESYAKSSNKFQMGTTEGLTTFTPTEKKEGEQPPPTFALMNPTTLVAASTEDLATLIASAKGQGGVPTSPALKKVIGAGDKSQIQLAMVLPETAKAQMQANPQSAAMANIQTFMLAINLTENVDLALRAAADSEANGKNVHDAFQGFLALGKMMTAEQPEVQTILNNLKLEQQGATTALTLSIKADELSKLVGQAMAMASAGMGGGAQGAETGAEGGEMGTGAEEGAEGAEEGAEGAEEGAEGGEEETP